MTQPTVLDREIFAEAEAARLLRVPQSTLHYWLDGGSQRGKFHAPIIRVEPTGSRVVTWAEFVEAGLLRSYRQQRVPMNELRAFIDRLRESLGVPYPLAHHRPYVSGRNLVVEAQNQAGLAGEFCLVATANNQLVLTSAAREFVERVTWNDNEDDIAAGWRPHDDPRSPVLMKPDIRFGQPQIGGISTDVIWEHDQGGEDISEIAQAFELSEADVRWALAYENSVRGGVTESRAGHQRVNGPAIVRFYIDADVLGLAKLMVQVRNDITFPGDPGGILHKRQRPPCPINSPKVLDSDWIPEVAARGWLIITRDANIAVNRAEIAAVRDNNARMVSLASREARTTFDQLELLMIQWRAVERLADAPGPFIYSATRTTLRPVPLTK